MGPYGPQPGPGCSIFFVLHKFIFTVSKRGRFSLEGFALTGGAGPGPKLNIFDMLHILGLGVAFGDN